MKTKATTYKGYTTRQERMKFGAIVVVGLPLAAASAAQAAETSDSPTAQSEAQYKMCLTEAHALQQRYGECTTKECRNLVTRDF